MAGKAVCSKAKDEADVSEVTRKSLIEKVKDAGDSKAWSDFYTRYNTLIRGYANSCCLVKNLPLTRDDIEDVVQNVMIEVSRKIGDFAYKPGKHQFRNFLATVTRRRCIDYTRKMNCRPDWNAEKPMRKTGEDGCERTDPIERLRDDRTGDLSKDIEKHDMTVGRDLALAKLRSGTSVTLKQYAVFEKIVMGMPVADICDEFEDLTLNAVYIIKTRVMPYYEKALRKARAELDEPALPPALKM